HPSTARARPLPATTVDWSLPNQVTAQLVRRRADRPNSRSPLATAGLSRVEGPCEDYRRDDGGARRRREVEAAHGRWHLAGGKRAPNRGRARTVRHRARRRGTGAGRILG